MPNNKSQAYPSARVGDGVASGIIIQGEESVLVGSAAKPVACKECKAKQLKGNPVNTSYGSKVQPGETDFSLPAPAPFTWQRFYASDTPFTGLLGQGWRTPLEIYCQADDSRTRLVDLQGRWIDFAPLAAGEEQYCPSEGLWIARGTLDQQVPWDERWQWLPAQFRHNPQSLIATPGDGDYLIFEAAVIPAPGKGQPAPRADGQYDLVAMINRHGYATRLQWNNIKNAAGQTIRIPEFVIDSASRIYRLHATVLSDASKHHWSSHHPDTDAGIRLSGISLAHDPQRDSGAPRDWELLRQQRVSEWLVRYQYSEAGDLIEVQDGDGDWLRRFEYRQHLMTRHQTPGGSADSIASDVRYDYDRYDVDGKVIRQVQAGGLAFDFVYAPTETTVTDNLGRVTRYRFEGEAGLKRLVELHHPDGSVVKMDYTSDGQMSRITDPLGRQTHFNHSSLGDYLGSTNPLGHRQQRFIDPATGLMSSTRNAEGQIARFQRDANGNITSIKTPDGSKTRFEYEHPAFPDRPSAIIDAKGGKKIPTYNALGQMASFTDCSGKTTRYHYDRKGRLQALDSADGKRQSYRRDQKGRITSVTLPDGSAEAFQYDRAGRLIQAIDGQGRPVAMDYDRYGRILEHRVWVGAQNAADAASPSGPGWSITRYQYDVAGRLVRLSNAAGAAMGFSYDPMDRLVSEVGFDAKRNSYTYNLAGELVAQIEGKDSADAIEIRHVHDDAGRLIARHIPAWNGSPEQVHRFTYNKLDQLTCAVTYNSQVDFAYNALGQLVAETQSSLDGHSQTLHYGYDLLGNRNQLMLPDGQLIDTLLYGSGHWHQIAFNGHPLIDVERDNLHREMHRTYGSGSAQPTAHPLTRTQSYTALGQLETARFTRGERLIEQRRYQYDQAGLLTHIDHELAALRQITRYGYDAQARLTMWDMHDVIPAKAGADGALAKPGYRQTRAAAWAYDKAGNPIAVGATARLDPVTGQAVYATPEQWAEQVKANADNPSFNLLGHNIARANRTTQFEDVRHDHDERGNVVRRQTRDGVWEFGWNALNQMTVSRHTPAGSSEVSYAAAYFYDAFGRRIGKLLLDLRQLCFDADGEPTDGSLPQTLTRFLWDGDRMLQEIHVDHTRTIVYEPNGFVPLAQIVGAKRTGTDELTPDEIEVRRMEQHSLTMLLANPALPQDTKQAVMTRLAAASAKRMSPADIYLFINDHLGTPCKLIDAATHETVWERTQDPWGNTLTEWMSDKLQEAHRPALRFQGQQWDWETGLSYNRYRNYDSRIHRYVSQDPIGIGGGFNAYCYGLNNPTESIDPLGLQPASASASAGTNQTPSCANDGTTRLEEIKKLVHENNKSSVDENLLTCQIYKESSFDPNATSGSGARGLMQLTTPALKQIYKNRAIAANGGKMISDKATQAAFKEGSAAANSQSTFDPATNVGYGTEYLEYLRNKNGGDMRGALEAYNGEPTKTKYAKDIMSCAEKLKSCPGSMPKLKQ